MQISTTAANCLPYTTDDIEAVILAAQTLARNGAAAQAEVRFRQALKQAELSHGVISPASVRVLQAMREFYGGQNRQEQLTQVTLRLDNAEHVLAKGKTSTISLMERFAPTKKSQPDRPITRASIPREIRQACQILGIIPEEASEQTVTKAWKKEMTKPSVHPDLGGHTEMAVQCNIAKDSILRWLNQRTPRLASKFGRTSGRQSYCR